MAYSAFNHPPAQVLGNTNRKTRCCRFCIKPFPVVSRISDSASNDRPCNQQSNKSTLVHHLSDSAPNNQTTEHWHSFCIQPFPVSSTSDSASNDQPCKEQPIKSDHIITSKITRVRTNNRKGDQRQHHRFYDRRAFFAGLW